MKNRKKQQKRLSFKNNFWKLFTILSTNLLRLDQDLSAHLPCMNILCTPCTCTPKEIYQSHGNNHLPLNVTNSQNTELKSNQSEVCKGFTPALFSQTFLCNCYSCGPPTTFRTINPTVIIQAVLFHQVGRRTWFLREASLDKPCDLVWSGLSLSLAAIAPVTVVIDFLPPANHKPGGQGIHTRQPSWSIVNTPNCLTICSQLRAFSLLRKRRSIKPFRKN